MLDLKKLLEQLLKHKVEFILIGGFAAVVHGSPSLTQDLDICFAFNKENIERLFKALEGANPQVRAGAGWIPLDQVNNIRASKTLHVITDLGKLDLLESVTGLGSFTALAEQTESIELFGQKCRILSIDALITSKTKMDRPKDREIVLQLKAIQEKLSEC